MNLKKNHKTLKVIWHLWVYIFLIGNFLKNYLKEDENNKHSSNDFGKNIIPKMLNNE